MAHKRPVRGKRWVITIIYSPHFNFEHYFFNNEGAGVISERGEEREREDGAGLRAGAGRGEVGEGLGRPRRSGDGRPRGQVSALGPVASQGRAVRPARPVGPCVRCRLLAVRITHLFVPRSPTRGSRGGRCAELLSALPTPRSQHRGLRGASGSPGPGCGTSRLCQKRLHPCTPGAREAGCCSGYRSIAPSPTAAAPSLPLRRAPPSLLRGRGCARPARCRRCPALPALVRNLSTGSGAPRRARASPKKRAFDSLRSGGNYEPSFVSLDPSPCADIQMRARETESERGREGAGAKRPHPLSAWVSATFVINALSRGHIQMQ